jgi:hypothetical protein
MPLQKILFKPGVNRENTRYTNEGGWYECDKVRFRQGTPEKIGGWTAYTYTAFLGVCRSLWNWVTLGQLNIIGVGTNLKFYLLAGSSFADITPIRRTVTLSNPFQATQGSSSITVTDSLSGVLVNDFVTFSGVVGLGGNITAAVLNKEFQVVSTPNPSTYTFNCGVVAGVGNTLSGGAAVVAVYQVNTGPETQVPFTGWGAGTWGGGFWGQGTVAPTQLQLWNQNNFGENLIFGPRGSGLYYWTASTGTAIRGVALKSLGGNVTITIASPAKVTLSTLLPEGTPIKLGTTGSLPTGLSTLTTYYISNADATGFVVELQDINGATINTSGTQSGTQSISDLVDVPQYQNWLLISDASRFTMVFGTNDYGSTVLDPMLIRWSAQEDPLVWTPLATNQAGSVRLSHGSSIITAIQTRQEIIVFTDQAVYSLQYLGPPYVWSSQLLGDNISIQSPNAAALASGVVYWMGVDKFYMYDGRVQTLNCDLRRFVFQNINQGEQLQVFASTNEGFNEVWWFYPSSGSSTVDRYVVYNYLEQVWYYGTMNRSAWLDSGLLPNPIAATYDKHIVLQESGTNNNETQTTAAIEAYISSSEFDLGDGHNFGFVWRVIPDLTFQDSVSAPDGSAAQVTMTLYGMTNSGSGATSSAGQNVLQGAEYNITEEFTGQIYTRVRGRQMIFKVASTQIGTNWQLGAPRIDIRPDGRR